MVDKNPKNPVPENNNVEPKQILVVPNTMVAISNIIFLLDDMVSKGVIKKEDTVAIEEGCIKLIKQLANTLK